MLGGGRLDEWMFAVSRLQAISVSVSGSCHTARSCGGERKGERIGVDCQFLAALGGAEAGSVLIEATWREDLSPVVC